MAEKKDDNKKKPTDGKRQGQTTEELKLKGKKGALIILARLTYALGIQNKFSGTRWANKEKKDVAGSFYQKAGPKGAIMVMDENSDVIKAALTAAKAAQADIAAGKWTPNVGKFLDAVLNVTTGVNGSRTRDYSIASELKL